MRNTHRGATVVCAMPCDEPARTAKYGLNGLRLFWGGVPFASQGSGLGLVTGYPRLSPPFHSCPALEQLRIGTPRIAPRPKLTTAIPNPQGSTSSSLSKLRGRLCGSVLRKTFRKVAGKMPMQHHQKCLPNHEAGHALSAEAPRTFAQANKNGAWSWQQKPRKISQDSSLNQENKLPFFIPHAVPWTYPCILPPHQILQERLHLDLAVGLFGGKLVCFTAGC